MHTNHSKLQRKSVLEREGDYHTEELMIVSLSLSLDPAAWNERLAASLLRPIEKQMVREPDSRYPGSYPDSFAGPGIVEGEQ